LETLKDALKNFKKPEDSLAISEQLIAVKKLVKACLSTIKLPKNRK